jgi:diguanylate cyclase (GGDEF)-like protein/PAS domain S-box-containing protein
MGSGQSDNDRWFRDLVDNLGDLVCRYRRDTTLVYVNRAYADYFGSTPAGLIGRSYLELVAEDLRPAARANTERQCEVLTPDNPVGTIEYPSAVIDGERHWLQWTDRALFDHDGRVVEFVSVGRDVTDRRRAEEQARHTARHDALTGLLNRRSLLEHLEKVSSHAAATGAALGLLYLDLDGFKAINDQVGHLAGDAMLMDVAATLESVVRGRDLVARIGGDEFVVLCPDAPGPRQLNRLLDRIVAALAALDPPVAVSGGITTSAGGEPPERVLHRADRAMYRTKLRRRARAAAGSVPPSPDTTPAGPIVLDRVDAGVTSRRR